MNSDKKERFNTLLLNGAKGYALSTADDLCDIVIEVIMDDNK